MHLCINYLKGNYLKSYLSTISKSNNCKNTDAINDVTINNKGELGIIMQTFALINILTLFTCTFPGVTFHSTSSVSTDIRTADLCKGKS